MNRLCQNLNDFVYWILRCLNVLVCVVPLLGNWMVIPMAPQHAIAPHAGGTAYFGHTVMLMKISKRKGKQNLLSGARHWRFTSVQTVAVWHFGVGYKRTKQARLESLLI